MDRASQVLAQGMPPGVPKSYRTLADYGQVPRSTLHYRDRGRPSMEDKARGQQYLRPYEEEVLVKYLLQMSDLAYLVRMKFIPSLAYSVTRHQVLYTCAHVTMTQRPGLPDQQRPATQRRTLQCQSENSEIYLAQNFFTLVLSWLKACIMKLELHVLRHVKL